MKVLHIVAGMNPKTGGVAQAVKGIIEGLNVLHIQNEVVCLDVPGEKFIEEYSFPIYALGPSRTAWRFSTALLHWLKRNVDSYDAVIVHGLWQYHSYAVIKVLAGIKNNRPALFVMPHGMLDPYFQKVKTRKLKALRNRIFWSLVEKALINKADCLLFTCEMERKLASQTFAGYSPKKTTVVGLGLSNPPGHNERQNKAFFEKCQHVNGKDYLLFISRIDEKKGVDIMVNAYLKLKSEMPCVPALVIAGPGLETPFGRKVQNMAGNSASIYFTGMLHGDAKWGAFYNCAAMVLPSHQENFGFVVVEALACGKPVLISNQVNIWEEVDANNAGLIDQDTEAGTFHLLKSWCILDENKKKQMEHQADVAFNKNFSLSAASARTKAALVAVVDANQTLRDA